MSPGPLPLAGTIQLERPSPTPQVPKPNRNRGEVRHRSRSDRSTIQCGPRSPWKPISTATSMPNQSSALRSNCIVPAQGEGEAYAVAFENLGFYSRRSGCMGGS